MLKKLAGLQKLNLFRVFTRWVAREDKLNVVDKMINNCSVGLKKKIV